MKMRFSRAILSYNIMWCSSHVGPLSSYAGMERVPSLELGLLTLGEAPPNGVEQVAMVLFFPLRSRFLETVNQFPRRSSFEPPSGEGHQRVTPEVVTASPCGTCQVCGFQLQPPAMSCRHALRIGWSPPPCEDEVNMGTWLRPRDAERAS